MWLRFPSLYAFQCRYNRRSKTSAFTFDCSRCSAFFALHTASSAGVPSHSGYTSDVNRMFFPSGDHNSPEASVLMSVSRCTPVTAPAAESKSAIHTCDPFSLVERNANRFPSGAHRGRSASCSPMSTLSPDAPFPVLPGEDEGFAGEPFAALAGPCAWFPSGTIHTCGVFVFAARSTSTALNSTHLPSGDGTGSPTRLSAIMSSNVNGRLPCEEAGKTHRTTTSKKKIRRMLASAMKNEAGDSRLQRESRLIGAGSGFPTVANGTAHHSASPRNLHMTCNLSPRPIFTVPPEAF